MFESAEILIILAVFVVAVLYSSVGHGGASGYLAVMAFAAISPNVTRPTALILNVFVASIAFFQFYREKHFDWKNIFAVCDNFRAVCVSWRNDSASDKYL